MIITEHYRTREDGVVLNRTYSNKGMMIERDGVRYSEAIDPADAERVYTETDEIAESLMVNGDDILSMLKEVL
jgi:hypothetical protein